MGMDTVMDTAMDTRTRIQACAAGAACMHMPAHDLE